MNSCRSDLLLASLDRIYSWADAEISACDAVLASRLFLGATKAILLQFSMTGSNNRVLGESGLARDTAEQLTEYRDDRGNFMAHYRGWDQDNVYDATRLLPDEQLFETDFYKNFLRPHKLRFGMAGIIARTHTSCIILSCYRPSGNAQFSSHDIENLRHVLPHWRRAMGLRNQLTQMDRHSQASHRILDHAPFSIMLMNSTREVLYANRWAKVINDRNDGLSLKHGRLSTATTDGTNRIRDMLESLSQPDRKANSPPELMAVERSSGEKPYQLMILPIQNAEEAGISTGPVYGVFVYDQKDRLPVDTSALKSLEGLTDSEAKLCESLYRTKSLAETAAQLQVSASTAKTHLLNTFRKLGINSQSELMRYLAHMPKLSSNQIQ